MHTTQQTIQELIAILIGLVQILTMQLSTAKHVYDNNMQMNTTISHSKSMKLISPKNNKIYFGAFPDFSGPEDSVSKERIDKFQKSAKKKIAWAYFSQNWYNGIKYPKKEIDLIHDAGISPFVRLMPRSDTGLFHKETQFTMRNIVDGKFDTEIKKWARDAKRDNIPLLIDFAVEMNGNWFSWSGVFNNAGKTDTYGDDGYPDGPELYRDAYRHIINIFRKEGVLNVTWFFHPDILSVPNEKWNQPHLYYPGDDYIDWIGVSAYGPLNPNEEWILFSDLLKANANTLHKISNKKPFALLEFGVTDNHTKGKKTEWLNDAFDTIKNKRYIPFSAISIWDETYQEKDGTIASISINSSKDALKEFQTQASSNIFISKTSFTNSKLQNINEETPKIKNIDEKEDTNTQIQPGTSWHWQLTGDIHKYSNIDLYDVDLEETKAKQIQSLHDLGAKVICYFNAGAYEPYRKDAPLFPKEALGKKMTDWEDERWLDTSHSELFIDIMRKRIKLAKQKGCDGVEPDNVQNYTEDTGFNITNKQQLNYNKWLSAEAHKNGLLIALKNDGEQVLDLIKYFDFAIVEECFQNNECAQYTPFISQNKAVLNAEYSLQKSQFCNKAKELHFDAVKFNMKLEGERGACD